MITSSTTTVPDWGAIFCINQNIDLHGKAQTNKGRTNINITHFGRENSKIASRNARWKLLYSVKPNQKLIYCRRKWYDTYL